MAMSKHAKIDKPPPSGYTIPQMGGIAMILVLKPDSSEAELRPEYIIPEAFDPRVRGAVASAVAEAARKSGVARNS